MEITLRDHLAVISNPVCLEIVDGGKILYKGYKGCLEYQWDKDTYLDRAVESFSLRVEAVKKRAPEGEIVITELNCGEFYYRDLYEKLVYSYTLAAPASDCTGNN